MPVEIWSRVMKAGHRGLAVAALPGVSNGPFAAIFPPQLSIPQQLGLPQQAAIPQPPAAIGQRQAPPAQTRTSLDGWLLDRLFGRR
jgi:penicillin-binding protein 1A